MQFSRKSTRIILHLHLGFSEHQVTSKIRFLSVSVFFFFETSMLQSFLDGASFALYREKLVESVDLTVHLLDLTRGVELIKLTSQKL